MGEFGAYSSNYVWSVRGRPRTSGSRRNSLADSQTGTPFLVMTDPGGATTIVTGPRKLLFARSFWSSLENGLG